MKSIRIVIFALTACTLSACAMTYKEPITVAHPYSSSVHASKAEILRAAKQVLVSDGFQITNTDESAGVISTAPHNLRVTPAQVDCGTTMGLDYLKDKRTSTRVAYGVVASDNNLIVKANIEGEYKPGAVDQDITLSCVSRGALENEMQAKIAAAMVQ